MITALINPAETPYFPAHSITPAASSFANLRPAKFVKNENAVEILRSLLAKLCLLLPLFSQSVHEYEK